MDWKNIQYLEYALFGFIGGLVVVAALFFLYRNSLNKLGKFAHRLYKHLFPYRSIWISLLAILSLTLLLVALARPRVGLKPLKLKIASGNIIILFDVSRSMLATDVSPSRFERGRIFLKMLINKLAGNNIALVIFAEDAAIVTPLTYDISAVLASLDAVDKSIIQEQGSKITDAIAKAEHIVSIDQPAQIVIISDGEFHEPKEEILKTAKQYKNWTFWTVGIGTKEGSPVPRGFNKAGYLKHNGKIVVSKLDEETLKLIAETGNGKYFHLDKVAPVVSQLSSLIQRKINPDNKEQVVYLQYNEWYPYLTMISLALLILIVIFPRRRLLFFIFIAFVFPVVATAQSAKILTYQAREALEKGDTQQALSLYQQALQKDSLYLPAKADLGLIKYGQQDYSSARIQWKSMLSLTKDKNIKSKLYYNIGNAFLKEKQVDSAIQYYIKALKLNPSDTLAQYNLSYALKMKRKQNQQQNQQNKQRNQQQNKQNNQRQQDNQQNDKNNQNNNSGKDQQNKNQDNGTKDKQDKNRSNQSQKQQPQDQRDEQQRTGQVSPKPQQLEAIDIQDREKMRAIIRGRLSKGRRTKSEKPW